MQIRRGREGLRSDDESHAGQKSGVATTVVARYESRTLAWAAETPNKHFLQEHSGSVVLKEDSGTTRLAIVEWRGNRMRKISLGLPNLRFNRLVHFGWAALLMAALCTWLFAPAEATADCGSATTKPNRSREQGGAQLKGNDRNDTGLEITLVNGKGLPIINAKVSLENRRRHIRLAGMTDSQGQVYIALPASGRYRLRIVFPDKKREDFWQEVDQHQLVQLKITYPPPVTVSPCDKEEPGSQVSTAFHGTSLPLPPGAALSHTPLH